MTDERNSDGTMKHPLVGANAPFDSESGALAIGKRWEAQRERNKRSLVKYAADKIELDVSELAYEDALSYVLMDPLFQEAAAGHIAGIKLALQLLDEMPDHVDAKVVTDARSVTIIVQSFDSMPELVSMMEELKEAGRLVAAARIKEQIEDGSPLDSIEIPID